MMREEAVTHCVTVLLCPYALVVGLPGTPVVRNPSDTGYPPVVGKFDVGSGDVQDLCTDYAANGPVQSVLAVYPTIIIRRPGNTDFLSVSRCDLVALQEACYVVKACLRAIGTFEIADVGIEEQTDVNIGKRLLADVSYQGFCNDEIAELGLRPRVCLLDHFYTQRPMPASVNVVPEGIAIPNCLPHERVGPMRYDVLI